MEREAAAVDLARTQHGLLTTRHAITAGFSEDAIHRHLRSGAWRPVRRGVYVIGAAATTWEQRVLAATLAAGDGAVAWHRTALRLWGFEARSGRPEVLLTDGRIVRLRGVATRRTTTLDDRDLASRWAIPVTAPARTLFDASPGQATETVGRWIDHGLRTELLTLDALSATIARAGASRRLAPPALVQALALRLEGHDPGESPLESRAHLALAALDAAGLPRPTTQHPVTRPDGRQAHLDLAFAWARIGIEADGFRFHRDRSAFDHDRRHNSQLASLGWTLLWFTSAMTDAELVDVVDRSLRRAWLSGCRPGPDDELRGWVPPSPAAP